MPVFIFVQTIVSYTPKLATRNLIQLMQGHWIIFWDIINTVMTTTDAMRTVPMPVPTRAARVHPRVVFELPKLYRQRKSF